MKRITFEQADASPVGAGDSEVEALKKQYSDGLGASLEAATAVLRPVIEKLLPFGIGRKTLVAWGVAAGYSKGYVETLLSRLMCQAGARKRQPGAGPKTPQGALLILRFACDHFGEETGLRYLLAGYRAGRRQAAARALQHQATIRIA